MIQNLLEEILDYFENGWEENSYDQMGNKDLTLTYCSHNSPAKIIEKINSVLEQIKNG